MACRPSTPIWIASFPPRQPETGRARMGKAAALPGQHAGTRDSHSALGDRSCRLGYRHRAHAHGSGAYPVPAAGVTTRFAATNVEQLQDSPIIDRPVFPRVSPGPGVSPKHYIDMVSDSTRGLETCALPCCRTRTTWSARPMPYTARITTTLYHFLLTLSDVRHARAWSTANRPTTGLAKRATRTMRISWPSRPAPHEFTHSWNGKYRRPVGLYQPDFATPQQGALLWVYEGMTRVSRRGAGGALGP